ncbi:hypothetical protein J22TS1_01790 [Siminovitchia terrae]|uniref:phage terminase small subunit n=1 Tax=Siminovitchia terrae TaxID=1914933 RepID=UPI001B146BB6|nr:phage terminase small subunit [Siminovitchia terrae]GIN89128.1 hypothetical protein J22TS1_01790 [Siminovitchia terrae]
MADKRIQAEKDYVKGMKYKDIAEKYGVSLNTVKSWKQRHGWTRNKGAPPKKSMYTKKPGAPKGNINVKGNNGGAPKGNSNAVTHGFFAKFLPAETMEIMEQMQERSPADLIYDQIQIQYASIIRAQQIMYVRDQDDITEVLKKKKDTDFGEEREWEFQVAWDKQANFLNALSRAMAEFRSLVKQFLEMANEDDERRLNLELMKARIDKTKGNRKHQRRQEQQRCR